MKATAWAAILAFAPRAQAAEFMTQMRDKNRTYGSPRMPGGGFPKGRPSWRPSGANIVDYRFKRVRKEVFRVR